MKIYWTKYALTKGIIELDVECAKYNENLYIHPTNRMQFSENNEKDWCISKSVAILRANKLREKKLISLKKQGIKIKELYFEI